MALYTDRHQCSSTRRDPVSLQTQFSRACDEDAAQPPHGRRVERTVGRWLPNCLAGATTLEQAPAVLDEFVHGSTGASGDQVASLPTAGLLCFKASRRNAPAMQRGDAILQGLDGQLKVRSRGAHHRCQFGQARYPSVTATSLPPWLHPSG